MRRRRTPGRPTTWGTTDGFLDHFGIEDVGDLPGMEELKAAGLLDAGPAISVYQSTAGKQVSDGAGGGDGGAQLELIETGNDELEIEPEEEVEPLDPEGDEAKHA